MNTVKPAARRKARKSALQALYQWHLVGAPLHDLEQQYRIHLNDSSVDMDYFIDLLHGVPKRVKDLDNSFESKLDRKLDDLDPIELSLLRIGAYELQQRLDVPYKVAINEAVELAKIFGAEESHKYINGILDQVAAEFRKEEMEQ